MIFTLGARPPEHNLLCKNDFTPFVGPWGSLVSFVLGVYVTPVQIRAGPLILLRRMRFTSSLNRVVLSITGVSCDERLQPPPRSRCVSVPWRRRCIGFSRRRRQGCTGRSIPFTHRCRNRMLGSSCLRTVFGDLPCPRLSIVRRSATHGGPEAAGRSMR